MPEVRRRYDPEFEAGAVRIVLETVRPIAQVAPGSWGLPRDFGELGEAETTGFGSQRSV